jgi:hypothetical protein
MAGDGDVLSEWEESKSKKHNGQCTARNHEARSTCPRDAMLCTSYKVNFRHSVNPADRRLAAAASRQSMPPA